MAKQDEQADKGNVRFNDRELEALRGIVVDWVNEQLVFPPFPREVTSVIKKLGIADQLQVPGAVPAPRNLQST
jgi:hypothetical protein